MWWKQCRSFIQQGCQALVFRSLGFIFYLVSVSSGSTDKMLWEHLYSLFLFTMSSQKTSCLYSLHLRGVVLVVAKITKGKKDSGGLLNAWGGGRWKETREEKQRGWVKCFPGIGRATVLEESCSQNRMEDSIVGWACDMWLLRKVVRQDGEEEESSPRLVGKLSVIFSKWETF